MVLERSDATFGGVTSVDAGGDELVVHIFLLEEVFQDGGALIVKSLELGAEAGLDEPGMNKFVRIQNAFGSAVAEGLGKQVVAVVVVYYHEVVVATAGGGNKSAGLVAVDLSGGFHDGSKECMGSSIDTGGVGIFGDIVVRSNDSGRRSSGTLVLARLVLVAFDGGAGLGWVFAEGRKGKAGEIGQAIVGEGCFKC
jgi:hypothetical protein